MIHRDLKPANILLTADGAPKVGDFGLAKLGDDPGRSRSGLIIGTPSYMAPEQAAGRGDLVGPPADVWALGAILYECLTRRPPFLGENSAETVHQVLTTEPAAPARLAAGVPRDLDTICLKCLRKEPDRRYRTAGDLADDLTRFLEGRPILARRVPWWEQLGKWARRRPAAAGLIVVTLAAGAALAGVGYAITVTWKTTTAFWRTETRRSVGTSPNSKNEMRRLRRSRATSNSPTPPASRSATGRRRIWSGR